MKKSTKIILSVLSVAAIGGNVAALAGCNKTETIKISGSTSVNEIMEVLAGEYEETHNVRIEINANGSSAGIEDTLNGRNEIGMASRALKDEEISQGLEQKQLCLDGIAIVTGKDSALTQVSNDQVYNLFVNGTAFTEGGVTISAAAGRDASSGTREAFDEKICDESGVSIKTGQKTYNAIVNQASSTGTVISAIQSDANNKTIGYVSLGSYLKNTDKLKALNFKAYGSDTYVVASTATVKDGSYALQRPFMIITKTDTELSSAAQAFYDWIFEDDAALQLLTDNGYVL